MGRVGRGLDVRHKQVLIGRRWSLEMAHSCDFVIQIKNVVVVTMACVRRNVSWTWEPEDWAHFLALFTSSYSGKNKRVIFINPTRQIFEI